ncbi:arginase family protein [Synechococcus sp. BA-124 BA4]|uniref:arginase family protein n=1 Tax=Synechococcus sp. BA-124 BA4 TaxID=3110251 RepID=UPI002B21C7D2|nr:arginase family protein [Synechococcus sp. BA-124 BA4]MEA5400828.1 arginase family protein [Synechococcus sp. BA-124 BA4]
MAPLSMASALAELHCRELELVFRLFDANGDGQISVAETERALANLGESLSSEAGAELLALANERGYLDSHEFTAWALGQGGFDLSRNLREIFALVDRDGSGSLSLEEMSVLLSVFEDNPDVQRLEALMRAHDVDHSGTISYDEFLNLLLSDGQLALSLADMKRLKKTLVHYSTGSRCSKICLVEVDCDLGAGIPGSGSGIELLKQAAQRQKDLRRIRDQLIEEISEQQLPRARASEISGGEITPHARHIRVISQVMAQASELVASSRQRGLFPVVLAGDHSTAAGTIAGLRRAHPDSRLGVVWIDAHADIHSPYTTPSGNMHGMPLGVATGHDNLHHAINDPAGETADLWKWCQALCGTGKPAILLRDLIYVSVRDTEPAEEATIRDFGLPIVSTEEVRRIGGEAAARRCLDYLADCDLIYVSFDVDSMDATVCKGTGTPVLGGLWAHEALEINRTLLRDPRVCCWEICEINPHLDTLNSLAEVSLGIYQGVLDVLEERL